MTVWVVKPELNATVTSFYMDMIAKAYKDLDIQVNAIHNWDEYKPGKGDITLVSTSVDALKPLMRRQRYIWWIQGTFPEENYYKRHSKIKFAVLSFLEKVAIRNASFVFYVSNAMKKHYEGKYKIDTTVNSYIMPCSNEVLHPECFSKDRYNNLTFCYAGSFSRWQCVEQTLDIYKKIEDVYPQAKLLMLVKDAERAKKMLNERGIKHYEIDFVPVEQLQERMEGIRYGFIIREDEVLNRVATPTKLSTYMANGIIPIYSDCLDGLNEVVGASRFVVKMSDFDDIQPIMDSIKEEINPEDVREDYRKHFEEYYTPSTHIQRMKQLLPR